jgi:MYXO-CTERM domain-containing protein
VRTPFQIESPNFPAMLAPNETVTFSVGFHPTRKGPISEVLRITSPQLPGEPLEVTLFGFGTAPDDMPPDGGSGKNGDDDTSSCACSGPAAPSRGWPIALALVAIFRRRRAPSSAR